jgi:Lrp/AsnC family transcriptional regulator
MGFVLDAIDRRILRELQADATVPIAELAERAGLSQTPCWKRVKRLTDAGVIEKRVALLDREQLDLGLVVFVSIKTSRHDEDWLTAFARTCPRPSPWSRSSSPPPCLSELASSG